MTRNVVLQGKIFSLFCLWFWPGLAPLVQAEQTLNLAVLDEALSISRFPAEGQQAILWIAPSYGGNRRVRQVARSLSQRGVEVWHVDLPESLFLPRSSQTLRELDGRYVAGLIDQMHRISGKRITLVSRSNGAIPLLRGARLWQLSQSNLAPGQRSHAVSGAILFSPHLYLRIPPLGMDPEYAPIASATSLPVMLYQAGDRSNRWQLDRLLQQLRSGGASVHVRVLPGVTGVFYEKDTSTHTLQLLRALPEELVRVMALLDRTPTSLQVPALRSARGPAGGALDIDLQPFRAGFRPLPIDLADVRGRRLRRDTYTGRVTVINFWASWCGPCVEEIPALNNLRRQMLDKPFELISINYAEDSSRIEDFLHRVNVDFPVLLDSDGRLSAQWNVLVFPSTFVIGPDGEIVYGVNGAIHWDSPAVLERLDALLQEAR